MYDILYSYEYGNSHNQLLWFHGASDEEGISSCNAKFISAFSSLYYTKAEMHGKISSCHISSGVLPPARPCCCVPNEMFNSKEPDNRLRAQLQPWCMHLGAVLNETFNSKEPDNMLRVLLPPWCMHLGACSAK